MVLQPVLGLAWTAGANNPLVSYMNPALVGSAHLAGVLVYIRPYLGPVLAHFSALFGCCDTSPFGAFVIWHRLPRNQGVRHHGFGDLHIPALCLPNQLSILRF